MQFLIEAICVSRELLRGFIEEITVVIIITVQVYIFLLAVTSLQLLEVGRLDVACRVLLTPNFEISSQDAKAVVELSRVGRRVVCS